MAQQSCAMVLRRRFFLRPVFTASRVQHVSDLHLKFALRPHHVSKYGRHPIMRRLRLGEEKTIDERIKKPINQSINQFICQLITFTK